MDIENKAYETLTMLDIILNELKTNDDRDAVDRAVILTELTRRKAVELFDGIQAMIRQAKFDWERDEANQALSSDR